MIWKAHIIFWEIKLLILALPVTYNYYVLNCVDMELQVFFTPAGPAQPGSAEAQYDMLTGFLSTSLAVLC